ncbi:MAG: NAD-dependent epimerase/dehydratase family protein [Tagaea sp.]
MAIYLVTGGAGFIGTHLVESLLDDGHAVRVLDDLSTGVRENLDPRAELVVGDAGVPGTVQAAILGVAGIFHLVAVVPGPSDKVDWRDAHRANLTATLHAVDAARAANVPVVYASSCAVYGDCADSPLSEAARPMPISAYGADKLAGESHIRAAGRAHGLPSAVFRLFDVFGPRQNAQSPYADDIPAFCESVRRGESCVVPGDGKRARDLVYVADAVAALRLGIALAASDAPIFNVGTGRPTTRIDLARRLQRLSGSPADPAPAPPRADEIGDSLADIRKLAARGWAPRTGLDEGLRATLAWHAGA